MSLHPFYCDPLDCSLSLYFEAAQLLVPWPKEESPILAPIRPFQNEVSIQSYPIEDRQQTKKSGLSAFFVNFVLISLKFNLMATKFCDSSHFENSY